MGGGDEEDLTYDWLQLSATSQLQDSFVPIQSGGLKGKMLIKRQMLTQERKDKSSHEAIQRD
jgi:hypothetical protein